MESKATLKNLGISTKKVSIPAKVVRGMTVLEALTVLKFMEKEAAAHVAKVIESAAANAQSKNGVNKSDLLISEIRVDKGNARIKHFHPRAKGGGYYMWLRGKSHISVVLTDKNEVVIEKEKKSEKKKVVKKELKKEVDNSEGKKVEKKTTKSKAKK